jgi:hypothetical protein
VTRPRIRARASDGDDEAARRAERESVYRGIFKAADDNIGNDEGDAGGASVTPITPKVRALHELAQSVSTATGWPFEQSLNYLLHNKFGRQVAAAFLHKRKGFSMPSRVEVLKGLLRQHGGDVVALCKHIAKVGSTDVTEAELTGMISAAAQLDRQANETSEQAFARKFNDQSRDGIALRKAIRIASGYTDSDDHLGDAFDDADSWSEGAKRPRDDDDDTERDDDDDDAYDELCEQAKALAKRDGSLSFEQAFAKVYTDNPALARRERQQNRPYLIRG